MHKWIIKEGYETQLLADESDLSLNGTQIQLVRFKEGKYTHHHKRKTEFFYFTKGTGKVIIDNIEKKIVPGSSFLIKPNVNHTFITSEGDLEAIMFKTNDSKDDTYTE